MLRANFDGIKEKFYDKAPRKNYKGANFYGVAYNFHALIRQFFRSYRIVSAQNAKRGKAQALPLFAIAKISRKARFAKTRPVVPLAVKAQSGT